MNSLPRATNTVSKTPSHASGTTVTYGATKTPIASVAFAVTPATLRPRKKDTFVAHSDVDCDDDDDYDTAISSISSNDSDILEIDGVVKKPSKSSKTPFKQPPKNYAQKPSANGPTKRKAQGISKSNAGSKSNVVQLYQPTAPSRKPADQFLRSLFIINKTTTGRTHVGCNRCDGFVSIILEMSLYTHIFIDLNNLFVASTYYR